MLPPSARAGVSALAPPASTMRINLLLSLGILLGLIGASLLVAFAILYVKPYMMVRTMILTTCTTSDSFSPEGVVTCTCANDGSSCRSGYPCLRLLVNFTREHSRDEAELESQEVSSSTSSEETEVRSSFASHSQYLVTNASLYNNFETFILQRHAMQVNI